MPTTTTTRDQLAAALNIALPGDIQVRPAPTSVDPLGADVRAVIVLHRKSITPAKNQGHYREDFDLWVMVEGIDIDLTETALDLATDDVLTALRPLTWVAWTAAERDRFDEQKPAYRITVTVLSTPTESEPTP